MSKTFLLNPVLNLVYHYFSCRELSEYQKVYFGYFTSHEEEITTPLLWRRVFACRDIIKYKSAAHIPSRMQESSWHKHGVRRNGRGGVGWRVEGRVGAEAEAKGCVVGWRNRQVVDPHNRHHRACWVVIRVADTWM